ncbi:MAG TPA: AraC family transcriptional regulator [Pseudomonadota bacterium]|nr:AraC family transcriptional regulator [Pseudomonadota bacterium]
MVLGLAALAGLSIGMALLLAVAMFSAYRGLDLPWSARLGGLAMLAGLSHTVWAHVGFVDLSAGGAPLTTYGMVLFLQSFGFYLLLRGMLRPGGASHGIDAVLLAAVFVLAAVTPPRLAVPVSLLMGTGFAVHLAVLLYRLRTTRRWFRIELPVVGLFAVMGGIVAVSGWLAPAHMTWSQFALVYSAQIALAFLLVGWLLLTVPDLVGKTREAVAISYATSSLGRVDVDAAGERLRHLFEAEHLYRDETLSLSKVAALVELSTHQLSELLNTRFGLGFSRYVRQHRVAAARRMLVEEPRASVLSVGLSVGFGSQSTFYVAFKDEVGVVPGEYRRQQLGAAVD